MDLKKLIAVATGEIAHANAGLCPDMAAGYDSRDPECLACRIIVEAEREKQEPAPAKTAEDPRVRIEWRLATGMKGHGNWHPADWKGRLGAVCAEQNETYGEGTHRVVEEGADHPEHDLELVGQRGCNSRHGGKMRPDPCLYRMRTTDPGCTGCVERDEDQPSESA